MEKPRVPFCWICGRKLWGTHFEIVVLEDGHERICHKSCAKKFEKERKNQKYPTRHEL